LGNGILSKNRHDDESILAARERVVQAERAEAEADRARQQAQNAVHQARLEVKRLEQEAEIQAKLAQHKVDSSKAISKRAKPLGRKFLYLDHDSNINLYRPRSFLSRVDGIVEDGGN
jgi:hypothetical protein